MAKKLEQTKNSFKVIGKVTRIDKDGAFRQDEGKKDTKYEGVPYHALRFGVKTSETNEVTTEMFDYQPEEVFLWNSDKKKKDPNYKGDRVPFEKWQETQDRLREKGFAVLQTRIGLTYGEDGKIESRGLPAFVASKEIYDNLNNGDNVVIEGEIRYSSFENQQGKKVNKNALMIKKVFKLKDVDFESEKFEEVSYFEQQMIFVDADKDVEAKKVFVTGRTIDYKGNWSDIQFVVDYSDGDGVDKVMQKLADAFMKKFKFGDRLNAFGNIVNRVIVEETEDENDDDDDLLASLGGKSKPQHAQKYQNRTYVSELQINGVDAWDKAVYTEGDFQKDSIVDDSDNKLQDELGGKKKKGKNPFEKQLDDADADIDMSEDDLPF